MKTIITLAFLALASGCATIRMTDSLPSAETWMGTDLVSEANLAVYWSHPASSTTSTKRERRSLQRSLVGTVLGAGLGAFLGAAVIGFGNDVDFNPFEKDKPERKGVVPGAIVGASIGILAAQLTQPVQPRRITSDRQMCGYGPLRGPVQTTASGAANPCRYGGFTPPTVSVAEPGSPESNDE